MVESRALEVVLAEPILDITRSSSLAMKVGSTRNRFSERGKSGTVSGFGVNWRKVKVTAECWPSVTRSNDFVLNLCEKV
jgi:hypothetical protein